MPAKKIPFGLDPLYDIRHILINFRVNVIIDVGANIGQSAYHFIQNFPDAQVHCIEPISETYKMLEKNARGYQNITCHNLALGSKNETMMFKRQSDIRLTRVSLHTPAPATADGITEHIEVRTLTSLCTTLNLNHIEYLKIDTEGYDLEVLRGAQKLLETQSIDLIEAEVSMNRSNTHHQSFTSVLEYLEDKHYLLFGIYEQSQEWLMNKPILRRSNVLFISRQLADNTNNNNSNFNRIDQCDLS